MERIEGHAMGGVSEVVFGTKDLTEALAVNEMADGAAAQASEAIEAAIDQIIEGHSGKAVGYLKAALVALGEHERLERVVEKLLSEETPAHMGEVRTECTDIIGLCQPNHPRIVA